MSFEDGHGPAEFRPVRIGSRGRRFDPVMLGVVVVVIALAGEGATQRLWAKAYGAKGLCLAGGVAANSQLRERVLDACMEDGLHPFLPSRAMCTDNAAMVAAAGWLQRLRARPMFLLARALAGGEAQGDAEGAFLLAVLAGAHLPRHAVDAVDAVEVGLRGRHEVELPGQGRSAGGAGPASFVLAVEQLSDPETPERWSGDHQPLGHVRRGG